jgi:hypothetical protein
MDGIGGIDLGPTDPASEAALAVEAGICAMRADGAGLPGDRYACKERAQTGLQARYSGKIPGST